MGVLHDLCAFEGHDKKGLMFREGGYRIYDMCLTTQGWYTIV